MCSAPRIILLWLFILLTVAPPAALPAPPAEDVVPFSDRFPVEIEITGHIQVYDLAGLGIDIDAASDELVRAYVSEAEESLLRSLGYEVRRIPNEALRMWRSLEEGEQPLAAEEYHDYAELTAYLQAVAADHPDITRLVSIGKTVQNRDLWFLKITDNPDVEENEPEFKYVSTMHGDEVVGVENCLKFIDWLTDNYDSATPEPWLERLVDEVEIWIMPMMNPDGNAAGSRYNANGVDLNRAFPDWFNDPNNTPDGREPEVAAMMIFSDSMSFDLSANFHGGALVVNYPHDNQPARAPDDSLYIAMSLAYSYHNPPMWNSSTFDYGITNGWDWYETHGSMQDWSYDFGHDKEVTIEISQSKWPPASQLPQFWADNDTSMVAYLEYCLEGVRGVVTDSVTGEPLLATVTVEGIAWDDRTDPDVGDYHRILEPGAYTLTFSAPDYIPKAIAAVEVVSDSATVLDVELSQAQRVDITGTVTSADMSPLLATVEARYHAGGGLGDSTTTDPADGSYALDVAEGEYDITVRSAGYSAETVLADVRRDTTIDFMLDPVTGTVLVIDDYSAVMILSKNPDFEVSVPPGMLGASASDLAADLETLGYGVVEETAASSDPETWSSYGFIVWSSGNDTSPVSSATYRRNLIDFVAAGGRLLIEGGEVGYDAASSPGYPDFADSVLHISDWNGDDVGPLVLDGAQAGHAVVTDPNAMPATLAVNYGNYGDLDAVTPSGEAYLVYATSDYPGDAGLLIYDSAQGPGIVYYAFAYSALSDRAEARSLLENTALYLMDEAAGIAEEEDRPAGRVVLLMSPNPFVSATTVSLSLPERAGVSLGIFDAAGRLVRSLAHETLPAGTYTFRWDGRDSRGHDVAPGAYFCSLTAGSGRIVRKVILLR